MRIGRATPRRYTCVFAAAKLRPRTAVLRIGRRVAESPSRPVAHNGVRRMRAVLQDLRYALRRARSRAGFTAIAILSIGLGVGVNTAAFSLVNAIVLRKTPVARADRVAELDMASDHGISGPLSYADVKELREQSNGVFSQIGLAKFTAFTRDLGDHVETLTGELVNGDFFPLIGIPPAVGRLLGP